MASGPDHVSLVDVGSDVVVITRCCKIPTLNLNYSTADGDRVERRGTRVRSVGSIELKGENRDRPDSAVARVIERPAGRVRARIARVLGKHIYQSIRQAGSKLLNLVNIQRQRVERGRGDADCRVGRADSRVENGTQIRRCETRRIQRNRGCPSVVSGSTSVTSERYPLVLRKTRTGPVRHPDVSPIKSDGIWL